MQSGRKYLFKNELLVSCTLNEHRINHHTPSKQLHSNNVVSKYIFPVCLISLSSLFVRRYMAKLLPIRRKALSNQSINQSIKSSLSGWMQFMTVTNYHYPVKKLSSLAL